MKVDSIENGENYLLIGEDGPTNGRPIALVNSNGSDTTLQVTVRSNLTTADGVTYSDGYIELNNSNAVFTASGDANSGYFFKNGNYYIGGTDETILYKISDFAVKVTYDATNNRLKTKSDITRYLYYSTYNSGTWKWTTSSHSSSSSRAMYIYKEVTAQIPTSSQVVYKMHASDLEHVIRTNDNKKKLDYTLLINGKNATSETLPAGGSYRFTPINSTDDNAIITSISADGVIDFNGKEGKQYVKVEYNWSDSNESYSVYKYVVVSAVNPYYTIEITDDTTDTIVNNTIVIKNVKLNPSYDLGIKLLLNGLEDVTESLESSKITWISSDENIAKIDSDGIVTFPGAEGTVHITVVYELEEGKSITDSIVMSVSQNAYIVPEDGTDDFPEYPNEGAIRYDKTATAVGNFSETGIAQLELSMTGVPFTSENRMDVVLMLDRSSSMYKDGVKHRISSTVEATKVFIKNIVTNEDGSFNNNRIRVMDFLGGNLDSSQGGGSQHQYQSNLYTTT